MKKIETIIILFCLVLNTLAQTKRTKTVATTDKEPETLVSKYSENDIYNVNEITFYGFDFSKFHLSDPKRIGQDLRNYMISLTGFLSEHTTEKKLKRWLQKETVNFSYNAIITANKKINNDEMITPIKVTISKDLIQPMISSYAITEKEGIGYVIIYEDFDSNSKSVSAYSVFFDIATKKVLKAEYCIRKESNSFNRMSDWDAAAFATIKKLTDIYLDKKKATQTLSN